MSTHGGHAGHRHELHLDVSDVLAFRQGQHHRHEEANRNIHAACRTYLVASHGQGLSEDELHDIIIGGLLDEWPQIISYDVPLEDVAHHLQTALDRHKKRAQRYIHRHLLHDPTDLPDTQSDPHLVVEVHHALTVVSKIEHLMAEAVDSIGNDLEHDTLVHDLGLDELGVALRRGRPPMFDSEAEHRATLVRARRAVRKHLESLLDAAIRRGVGDVQVLHDARRLLHRGTRAIKQALLAAQEVQRRRPTIDE